MIYSGNVAFCMLNNQVIPDEGPKEIPLVLDFSASNGDPILVDLTLFGQDGRFSMLQSIFMDLSQSPNDVQVTIDISNQRIVAKTKTQGYYSVLAPNPIKLKFESLQGGLIAVPVALINVPIPGTVWNVS